MKYMSVAETAKKWKLSERSVRNYCAEGKVEGAFLTGKTWNIPSEAKKPSNIVKLKEEGLDLGHLHYVFAFMIKYLSPLLILGIDILGIADNIFPSHTFSIDGLIVEIMGLAIIGILIGIFFIFLRNKNLGDNQSEVVE